jgi:hypothetical protein
MPLQVKDLGKEQRTFIWDYLGEEVSITYNVYKFTPEMEEQINEGGVTEERMARILVENLLIILIAWDVMDGEEVVPIEFDAFMSLPTRLLGDLMMAIGEDAGGDAEQGKRSGGRSQPNRASRRASVRGIGSSKQQGSFG